MYRPDGRGVIYDTTDRLRSCEIGSGEDAELCRTFGKPNGLAYSLDGKWIACPTYQGLTIWETASKSYRLKPSGPEPFSVAFSLDGRTLAAGFDGDIQIWDTATWKSDMTLRGHSGVVRSVAFSPDGGRIVSSGDDTTVRLWDTITGRDLLTLRGHTAAVASVAFSPDGRTVISGSSDGTIRFWESAPWTTESRTLREARSVVDFLAARQLPAAEVLARIRHDPTISEQVRRRALELAEHTPGKSAH